MTSSQASSPLRLAVVCASWHSDIVGQCRHGFERELAELGHGNAEVQVFHVPGSLEIPLLLQRLARTGQFDGLLGVGFVVDGGIYRHDFVAASVIDGLMRVQLDTGVPVFSAVLTPHQFQETPPHIEFFRDHFVKKGQEAARACVETLAVHQQVTQTFGA